MASSHRIELPPSPPEPEPFRFGDYLAGLADGEGCFNLGFSQRRAYNRQVRKWYYSQRPSAAFVMALRADDAAILGRIQAFLQSGILRARDAGADRKPQVALTISRTRDLIKRVVPQFTAHPLKAKKANDFVIWEKAVRLLYEVRSRPVLSAGQRRGVLAKWTEKEINRFVELKKALEAQRGYDPEKVIVPTPEALPPRPEPPGLFDGLP